VSEVPLVKLPGWVRRSPELTPRLDLRSANASPDGPDIGTLQNPANDVAYKMIGGAYGVLGAEVLGQFVPRVLDQNRWGIYVREAGVAWLCWELGPHLATARLGELPLRMARSIAAHHYVHSAVEAAVSEARGEGAYHELLVSQAPRHGNSEELLAELHFRVEALSGLDRGARKALEGPLGGLMARAPEGRDMALPIDLAKVVETLNAEASLALTAADSDFTDAGDVAPTYLVIEPHLPEQLASSIRRALLG
jgi:hypothetical protein